ncbi:hypothetical protein [Rubrimonas cliftonensis]|uniref:Uncharacterized protein n=1 Tax=Rubrimonas cliftonensis TaxID=89524 RepID=A0A1H4FL00_9RHOB|nr:hypothetical protein [Rubrimonas cliftonensis]SEA97747.1 hypothetical protein SAMN05444370_1242 [Rubrimonas cliftonensis]
MTHDRLHIHQGRGPAAALASAWNTLCCLPTTHPWFWLVRSAPPGGFATTIIEMCAFAHGATPALGLVLLNALPVLLDALGAGAFRHG